MKCKLCVCVCVHLSTQSWNRCKWTDSKSCGNQVSSMRRQRAKDVVLLLGYLSYIYCYSTTVVPIFPLCPPPPIPTPLPHSQFPHCCPCPWSFIHVLCHPLPFFPPLSPSPHPSVHFQSVLCFHACGSILLFRLFCSLDSSYR